MDRWASGNADVLRLEGWLMCADWRGDQMICLITFTRERRAFIFCDSCSWQREIEYTDELAEETKKPRKPTSEPD